MFSFVAPCNTKRKDHEMEERRKSVLTDADVEKIAERAATIAIDRVYTEIGRSVVKKTLFIVGASVFAIFAWLAGTGQLK